MPYREMAYLYTKAILLRKSLPLGIWDSLTGPELAKLRSERCAPGGGCLIEVIANVLRIDLSDFGPLAAKSRTPITFGTGCAVFGESEAIIRVSELNTSLPVPPHPQFITALGATITAATSVTPESSKKQN